MRDLLVKEEEYFESFIVTHNKLISETNSDAESGNVVINKQNCTENGN